MASANFETFLYPPLLTGSDSLRILIIKPLISSQKSMGISQKNQEITFDLVPQTFASKPDYECLSYTWGTAPATKIITINGQPFPVRENLFQALVQLRQNTTRSIWIDAICINQKDISERNAQVSLMATIYKRARQVVVWLGVPPTAYSRHDNNLTIIENETNRKAIATHAYWSRLWIIQEIILARKLLFVHGSLEIKENNLEAKLEPEWSTLEERVLPLLEHRKEKNTSSSSLEELIIKFQGAQCIEPRDQVFGLLGMANDTTTNTLKVDYEVDLFELYRMLLEFHTHSPPYDQGEFPDTYIPPNLDRPRRLMQFSR